MLPTHVAGMPVPTGAAKSFVSKAFSGEKERDDASPTPTFASPNFKPSFGFGRQGEKAAGLRGFIISKPMESLPRYAPKPASTGN
jgi:hypothetical protein